MTRTSLFFALLVTLSPAIASANPDVTVSLPWQLRPLTTGNVVSVDSAAAAFADGNGNLDVEITTMFTGSYRLSNGWAPMLRIGVVDNNAPGAARDRNALANPVVGATYARTTGNYRVGLYGGATLPIGTSGARTSAASMTARPADRAMFEIDALAAIVGVDTAYVRGGLTAQGEVTVVQYLRVRGDAMATDPEASAALGLHLGYRLGSHVAIGADLHYEDTLTASFGVRAQWKIGDDTWIRPGLAYVRGIDDRGFDAPLLIPQTTALQIDVPVTF